MNNQITKIIIQNRNIEISSDKDLEFVIDKLNKNLIKTCFILKNKKLIVQLLTEILEDQF